jgi:hypothetical protein
VLRRWWRRTVGEPKWLVAWRVAAFTIKQRSFETNSALPAEVIQRILTDHPASANFRHTLNEIPKLLVISTRGISVARGILLRPRPQRPRLCEKPILIRLQERRQLRRPNSRPKIIQPRARVDEPSALPTQRLVVPRAACTRIRRRRVRRVQVPERRIPIATEIAGERRRGRQRFAAAQTPHVADDVQLEVHRRQETRIIHPQRLWGCPGVMRRSTAWRARKLRAPGAPLRRLRRTWGPGRLRPAPDLRGRWRICGTAFAQKFPHPQVHASFYNTKPPLIANGWVAKLNLECRERSAPDA